jgi:hypothetical protein
MSYGETRDFLAAHTEIIELADAAGARVAVAPQWQARVMTSTFAGPAGPSFGFVNRDFIAAKKSDPHFNNYGGEDRLWLAPEGGQFGLSFPPGASQTDLDNWYTPPALNEGAWRVVSRPDESTVRMAARLQLTNAAATSFDLDAAREVRLLAAADLRELFGPSVAAVMGQAGVKIVGFESASTVTNRGPDFVKQNGLISLWVLGQMQGGPQTVAIAPYRPGPETTLGPVVKSDYCGPVPPDRLKIAPEAVLFRADSGFRSKIGLSQRRARNVLGSFDFQSGVLTLVQFTMPDEPARHIYLNNMCQVPQAEPFRGDVANVYNDGPQAHGEAYGAYYEIETLSPALVLKTGQSLTHRHRTIHVQADAETIRQLARQTLGVDLETVRTNFL